MKVCTLNFVKLSFAVILFCLATDNVNANSGSDPVIDAGCEYTARFLGAIIGWNLVGRSAQTAVQAGLAALGQDVSADMLTSTCSMALNEYVDAHRDSELSYNDYLWTYCNGRADWCPDPLLDINCGTPHSGCFPGIPPWDCNIGQCMPYLIGMGSNPISINDMISTIYFMEASLASNSWDRDMGNVMLP